MPNPAALFWQINAPDQAGDGPRPPTGRPALTATAWEPTTRRSCAFSCSRRAIGILRERHQLSEDDAFHVLRRICEYHNIKLCDVAQRVRAEDTGTA
ncbi:ANTAR domain-containing protein [Streptomyces sp. NPDC058295]|uniref:ANTAR domain-containing protein n=1 Tax=Streptomyces sp. NPDC058295 TaxID=3346431 RepID=UPI0036EF9F53